MWVVCKRGMVIDASAEPPFAGSWHDFGIQPALAEAIRTHKGPGKHLEQPSTVQRELMKAPRSASVYAIASTGSGKFFGSVAPALDDMLSGRSRSALVVAITNPLLDQHLATVRPILELAAEKDARLPKIAALKVTSNSVARTVALAAAGPLLLFSTPFQILALSKQDARFAAVVAALDYVILDEVDAIVSDPTFGREVAAVVKETSKARLIAVTATHTDAALAKVRAMAHQPVLHIVAGGVHAAVVSHTAVIVEPKNLLPILAMILAAESSQKALVFCSTNNFTELAFQYCSGADATEIYENHSRMNDGPRRAATAAFTACKKCVLFASDALARGTDVPEVSLVVQVGYIAPDLYMQRAGRTGRGLVKTGRSLLLLMEPERPVLDAIRNARGVEFTEMRCVPDAPPAVPVPSGVVTKGYQAFLGAYKTAMKPLRWSKAQLFEIAGDIMTGAGFAAPKASDQFLRKAGLA